MLNDFFKLNPDETKRMIQEVQDDMSKAKTKETYKIEVLEKRLTSRTRKDKFLTKAAHQAVFPWEELYDSMITNLYQNDVLTKEQKKFYHTKKAEFRKPESDSNDGIKTTLSPSIEELYSEFKGDYKNN